jgi:hypothetical protein
MWLGVSLAVLGLQCVYMGILSQVFFDYAGDVSAKWFRRFSYTRAVAGSAGVFALGLGLTASLAAKYLAHGLILLPRESVNHLGVTGLLFMIAGFMTFTFTLILHATAVAVRK